MSILQFSHETRTYVFRGKELKPPAPGTYDPKHHKPPTHQVFAVEIQTDGMWKLKLNGADIAAGECDGRSRSVAKYIIETHANYLLQDDSQ